MRTATACPGPCNSAWRRAESIREEAGAEHHLTPTWGRPVQCDGCTAGARLRLSEIPELLARVSLEAVHGSSSPTTATIGARGSSTTSPWPGQAARLLAEQIAEEMAELEADVLFLRGIRLEVAEQVRQAGVREGRQVSNSARILDAHLDWMMQHHPAAGEAHDRGNGNPAAQIRTWHGILERFVKAHPQHDVRKLAPCPRCKGPYLAESRDLRLVDDRPYIECRDPDCQRILTSAEYDEYVKALAAGISQAA
ncbi:hypothetical protein [Streptomyces sp. NPDC059708]|uniref:hypothetical protein n=1 Tax=Streptomyces sp. NPDC059708 TaxID=3346916 RepID=UPI0036A392D6